MSKYTTEVRNLMETDFNFGLNTYPIFDESYRAGLNAKILNHYKYREIGYETAGMWKDRLIERLTFIMPYFNQLYNSAKLEITPLLNFNTTENTRKDANTDNMQNVSANTTQNVNGNSTQNVSGTTGNSTEGTTTQESDATTSLTNAGTDSHTDTTKAIKNDSENSSRTATDNATHTTTENLKGVSSDTPQGLLSIGDIEGNVYASNADIRDTSKNDSATNTQNSEADVNRNETTDTTTTHSGNNSATSDGTNHATSTQSNTQTVSGTNAQETTATNTQENKTANIADTIAITKNWETFLKSLSGFSGVSQSVLLQQFRETFLNIDKMVIDELANLFLNLW